MTNHNKIGVLLLNIGTPDKPNTASVRKYLKEFLSDPRVVDIPWLLKNLLLYLFILPSRPAKSAKAYQAIWRPEGSPLLYYSLRMQENLHQLLGKNYQVELGMCYRNPSIEKGIEKLYQAQCDHIIIFPLFPQYSSAATGASTEKALRLIAKKWNIPSLETKNNFYNNPGFINAYSCKIKEGCANKNIEHYLFSFHGLPERHIDKSEGKLLECSRIHPCPQVTMNNHYCYRAQCYSTSRLLAQHLAIPDTDYTVSFQSRLGVTAWIKPYTDEILVTLYNKGIRHLAVACPSFIADCLETIEEIGIRAKAQWLKLGGETLTLIPCLNDDKNWLNALAKMINPNL